MGPVRQFAGRVGRRATGIVRTVVVACATLAILLVCFAIYQYSQRDSGLAGGPAAAPRRTPALPPADVAPGATGVKVGETTISTGRKIKLTLYAREGDRARMQIEVAESIPVPNRSDEFRLVEPEIRLRTTRGNAVRVTADEGRLQAGRQAGGALDPQRGWLKGSVRIEIDRRGDEDFAGMSAEDRARPDPTAIMHVDMDEIEFDAEYAKVIVPGAFRLSASDVDLRASDLEIRFNEAANRVDLLRIGQGERLELRQVPPGAMGGAMPAMGVMSDKKLTLVDLLRSTIEARLATQAAAQQPPRPTPSAAEAAAARKPAEADVPAFIPDESKAPRPLRPAVKYFARFDKDIDATTESGGAVLSRLQADALEVLRDFREEDRAFAPPPPSNRAGGPGAMPPPPREKIVLLWTGPLVVEAVDPDDVRLAGVQRSVVSAIGAPVRVTHHEPAADATCARLTYSPDDAVLRLFADAAHAVVVRSPEHGVMTGTQLVSRQDAEAMHVVVTGPGSLVQHDEAHAAARQPGDRDPPPPTTIEFADSLDLFGRTVMRRRLDLSGTVSSRQSRVLDKAVFAGGVTMRQDDTRVAADVLTVFMQPPRTARDDTPLIDRVEGRGNVLMAQRSNRINCDEIDIALATDGDGRVAPVTAAARGNVDAVQDQRTIKARDRLFVEFQTIQRQPPPFDAAAAYQAALAKGEDASKINWDERRLAHQAAAVRDIAVKHMKASGAVVIADPAQSLEVAAEELDCSLVDGRNIEEALVVGPADGPASVKLRTFSVSGRTIKLNVRDEWAEVPGAGRLSFRSNKDLNGQKLDQAIPITIEWQERMNYQGRENRARFAGSVHAVSRNDTTFDCDDLFVEFEDAAPPAADAQAPDWWIFENLASRMSRKGGSAEDSVTGGTFAKEPAFLEARGHARVATQTSDPAGGALLTRAVLAGPMLTVNLRKGASHMQMESPGTLLMEDYRPRSRPERTAEAKDDLLGFDDDQGPSQTLVEWKDSMFYNFANDQTRFEGDVTLRYLSGRYAQLAGGAAAPPAAGGRKTFLDCNRLHVDFLESSPRPAGGDSHLGRISAARLMQFQASENVDLRIQNDEQDFALACDDLKYEKDRQILSVQGTPRKPAEIVIRKASGEITTSTWLRFFYNTQTKRIEGGEKPTFGN